MKVISTTQARNEFSEIINQVVYKKMIIPIGRRKKCEVLMIPAPTFDDKDIPITKINSQSKSFKFLEEEHDLYSINDLKKKYV